MDLQQLNAESKRQSNLQNLLVIEQPDPSIFEQQKRAEEFEKIQMIDQQKIQAQLEAEEKERRAKAASVVSNGVETAEKKHINAQSQKTNEQASIASDKSSYTSYRTSAYTGAHSSQNTQNQTVGSYGANYGAQAQPQKPQKPITQKVTEAVFGALGEGAAEIRIERNRFSHPHSSRIYAMQTRGNGVFAKIKRNAATNPRKEKAFYSTALLLLKTSKAVLAFGLPVAAKSIFGRK